MPEPNWNAFYTTTKNHPPWPRLIRAADMLPRVGAALDLGCGAGRDTRYLVERGFRVTAVDQEAATKALLADLPAERLVHVQSSFEDFQFGRYDLINAHFALPFLEPHQFALVFARLKTALQPGAIFVGQFFGRNDSWNTPTSQMTFCSRQEAIMYVEGLEILEFSEEDQDGKTANGETKHWHVYHIIARKP